MLPRGCVATLVVLLGVLSSPVLAVEITDVEGNSFTVSDLGLPQLPGAPLPGGKNARDWINRSYGAYCVLQYTSLGTFSPECLSFMSPTSQYRATLSAEITAATIIVAFDLWLQHHVMYRMKTAADGIPIQLDGFEEGSTELTISGIPAGATVVTSYSSPGRGLMTSWLQDGSWGDTDGEVNGVVVTPPPRWAGPPHVLGGEIMTIMLDGTADPGLAVFEATGLGARYTVPVASHIIGAGGNPFISDLSISNPFGLEADGWVRFVADGADWHQAPTAEFSLAPGETTTWVDVLQSAFGVTTNTKGTLVIGGVPTWSLAVVSKNYVVDDSGDRFGIAIPGLSSYHPHTLQNIWVLPGVRQDDSFRSNLILAGAVPSESTVEIRLLSGGESLADPYTRTVPAYGLVQVNRVSQAMGVGDVDDAYLEITVVEGAVYAALSVVDGSAEDAAYQVATPLIEID